VLSQPVFDLLPLRLSQRQRVRLRSDAVPKILGQLDALGDAQLQQIGKGNGGHDERLRGRRHGVNRAQAHGGTADAAGPRTVLPWSSAGVKKALRTAKALKEGTVWINAYSISDPGLPSGGYKESGFGRERGHYALEEYTQR